MMRSLSTFVAASSVAGVNASGKVPPCGGSTDEYGCDYWGESASANELANVSNWDMSAVSSMGGIFFDLQDFNGDISDWNVSLVANMRRAFQGAESFNADISGWDVSSVVYMNSMFEGASTFNADISGWDVSTVQDMNLMFEGATSFEQDLSAWDTASAIVWTRDEQSKRWVTQPATGEAFRQGTGLPDSYPLDCLPGGDSTQCPYTSLDRKAAKSVHAASQAQHANTGARTVVGKSSGMVAGMLIAGIQAEISEKAEIDTRAEEAAAAAAAANERDNNGVANGNDEEAGAGAAGSEHDSSVPTSDDTDSEADEELDMDVAAKIGGVVVGVAVLLAALAAFAYCRRGARSATKNAENTENSKPELELGHSARAGLPGFCLEGDDDEVSESGFISAAQMEEGRAALSMVHFGEGSDL